MCGWETSEKLSVNDFKEVEDISKFDERFITSYKKKSDGRCCLEVDTHYLENLSNKIVNNCCWLEKDL